MQNALLVGLSRQMALGRELDIVANNIANVDTSGYKADNIQFSTFLTSGARDNEFASARDRRINFVEDRASWVDMSAGALERTGNPLDVAVDGPGFLVVQTPRGLRYTRNGSFAINATGQLVTSEGDQVMGTGGPITFQTTDHDVTISASGVVSARDGAGTSSAVRGQLQIASFEKPQRLQKDGTSLFVPPQGVDAGPPPQGARVVQGSVERSNVRPIVEMTRMIEITRSYSDIAAILQQHSDLRRTSLQQLAQAPSSTN